MLSSGRTAFVTQLTRRGRMTTITTGSLPTAVAPTVLELLPPFQRHLRAENKAPRTIDSYSEAVRLFHTFLASRGMPLGAGSVAREHVEAFVEDQLARVKPTSARIRYASLRA